MTIDSVSSTLYMPIYSNTLITVEKVVGKNINTTGITNIWHRMNDMIPAKTFVCKQIRFATRNN